MSFEQKKEKLKIIFQKLQWILPDHFEEISQYLVVLESLEEAQAWVLEEWLRLISVMIEGVDIETSKMLQSLMLDISASSSQEKIDESIFDTL